MRKEAIESRAKLKEAYIDMLLSGKNPNVREMCRIADVNKSTFYRNFPYLEDLEKELYHEEARALADEVIKDVTYENITDEFIEKLIVFLSNISKKQRILFFHNEKLAIDTVVDIVKEDLKKYTDSVNDEMLLVITVRGILFLLLEKNYTREEKIRFMTLLWRSYNKAIVNRAFDKM